MSDFRTQSKSAYTIAVRNKWLSDYTWLKQKENKYWTKERSFDAAKECKTIKEFRAKYSGAYYASVNNKWINDYTWFDRTRKAHNKKWTKETTEIEARKYNTLRDFLTSNEVWQNLSADGHDTV